MVAAFGLYLVSHTSVCPFRNESNSRTNGSIRLEAHQQLRWTWTWPSSQRAPYWSTISSLRDGDQEKKVASSKFALSPPKKFDQFCTTSQGRPSEEPPIRCGTLPHPATRLFSPLSQCFLPRGHSIYRCLALSFRVTSHQHEFSSQRARKNSPLSACNVLNSVHTCLRAGSRTRQLPGSHPPDVLFESIMHCSVAL